MSLIRGRITKQDTVIISAIAPELKLAITISYLATGSTFTTLRYHFRVHKCTISEFISEVYKALYEALRGKYMKVGKYILLMK